MQSVVLQSWTFDMPALTQLLTFSFIARDSSSGANSQRRRASWQTGWHDDIPSPWGRSRPRCCAAVVAAMARRTKPGLAAAWPRPGVQPL